MPKKGEKVPPHWNCRCCWARVEGKRKQNQRYCPRCRKHHLKTWASTDTRRV